MSSLDQLLHTQDFTLIAKLLNTASLAQLRAALSTLAPSHPLLRYKDQVVVIKYGGSFMDGAAEQSVPVVRSLLFLQAFGIKPVIVHGGGKAITRAMDKAGLTAQFIGGQRVTDAQSAAIVEQVLSYEINPGIVSQIKDMGSEATGFAGSSLFQCKKLLTQDRAGAVIDLGYVGEITEMNTAPVEAILFQNQIPVISPTARGVAGEIYNCNADVAAAQVAKALSLKLPVHSLIFMSDVPGVLTDPKDASTLIKELNQTHADELIASGIIDKGMIPKVQSAFAALTAGTLSQVSFVDGRMPYILLHELFLGTTQGTVLSK